MPALPPGASPFLDDDPWGGRRDLRPRCPHGRLIPDATRPDDDGCPRCAVEAGREPRRELPRGAYAPEPDPDPPSVDAQEGQARAAEAIETLVELARAGREEDFLFLAGALGVPRAEHAALWRGTRARCGKDP